MSAPGRTRTCDPLLRRREHLLRSTAACRSACSTSDGPHIVAAFCCGLRFYRATTLILLIVGTPSGLGAVSRETSGGGWSPPSRSTRERLSDYGNAEAKSALTGTPSLHLPAGHRQGSIKALAVTIKNRYGFRGRPGPATRTEAWPQTRARCRAFLLGKPLRTDRLGETLLPKRLALPVFCSDPLSSVAYATEQIVLVLGLGGLALLHLTPWVAAAVVVCSSWSSRLTDRPVTPIRTAAERTPSAVRTSARTRRWLRPQACSSTTY